MQGIVTDARCTVAAGQSLDIPLPPDTLGIVASPRPAARLGRQPPGVAPAAAPAAGEPCRCRRMATSNTPCPGGGGGELTVQLPNADVRYTPDGGRAVRAQMPANTKGLLYRTGGGADRAAAGGAARARPRRRTPSSHPGGRAIKWTAPAGGGPGRCPSSGTRIAARPPATSRGGQRRTKDTLYTLIDYLNPEATDTYLKLIYGEYEKVMGDEFGKTIMGFRADETDYTGVSPWTPKLLETVQGDEGLRFPNLHSPDLRRRPDDARGATGQGRLLGCVERHVP